MTTLRTILAAALLAALSCCATAAAPRPPVDLSQARAKIAEAEAAGAERLAPEPLERAVGHLQEAQDAVALGKGASEHDRAEALGRLALAEAEWAASLAVTRGEPSAPPRCEGGDPSRADLEVRLRRAEEDQRHLEERVTFLMKELDLTETEVVRTKAKIKGQTKAEASSAIAEARILLRRMVDEGMRSPNLAHCQELVNLAENLLTGENVAGAVFFAMTAQDLLEKTRKLAGDPTALDRPSPRESYVASALLNIRKNPGTNEPVVGHVPKGAAVGATTQRGDWIFVKHESVEGWVYAPLLQ